MKIFDKNNNITLVIFFIGVLILVLCKNNYNTNIKEGFYTSFENQDKLNLINYFISKEKDELEKVKSKIEMLEKNKGHDLTITKDVDGNETDFNVLGDLDTNEMVLLNNEFKNNIKQYNNSQTLYNIQQKIQDKRLDELNKNPILNGVMEETDDSELTNIKNAYSGTNLIATKVNKNKDKIDENIYLIQLNNDCLSYIPANLKGKQYINNYDLKQCNENDKTQYMRIDNFKLLLKNDDKDLLEKKTIVGKDESSYVKHFNNYIENDYYKIKPKQINVMEGGVETIKETYPNLKNKSYQMSVIQPYHDYEKKDDDFISKTNCLTADKEGVSFQDCRLDNSQSWLPKYNKVYC